MMTILRATLLQPNLKILVMGANARQKMMKCPPVGGAGSCWLMVDSGTTLRVVAAILAEMREHPGGIAYHMAMLDA
jgi:hypothetical protein